MISVKELYYLNRALDGKSIYGISPDNDKMELFGAEKVKQSLIKGKILDKDGSINDLSFHILRNLEKYKNSSEYIWINDTVMSLDESNFLIYFKDSSDGRLEFKKTTKEIMIFNIVKQYEFLWNNKEEEISERNISRDDFIKDTILKRDKKDMLYIEKVKRKKVISCDSYYKEGNKLLKYDFLREKLIKVNPFHVRRGLLNLFNMEVN